MTPTLSQLVKIPDQRAKDVCSRCALPAPATALLTPDMSPAEYIHALLAAKQFVAGIDFMAYALPAREGVWWACLTIQHAFGDGLAGPEKAACRAAVQWVLRPTPDNQVLARPAVDAAGPATAAGAAAMAASIGPSPGPFPAAKAVANAVKLSSIKANPAKLLDTQRLYIGLAIGVAEGRYM